MRYCLNQQLNFFQKRHSFANVHVIIQKSTVGNEISRLGQGEGKGTDSLFPYTYELGHNLDTEATQFQAKSQSACRIILTFIYQ